MVYPCRQSRQVMTIHDVTFMKYPEFVTGIVKTYTQRIKQSLQWTDLVIANSASTKRDIIEYLDVNPEKNFCYSPGKSLFFSPQFSLISNYH